MSTKSVTFGEGLLDEAKAPIFPQYVVELNKSPLTISVFTEIRFMRGTVRDIQQKMNKAAGELKEVMNVVQSLPGLPRQYKGKVAEVECASSDIPGRMELFLNMAPEKYGYDKEKHQTAAAVLKKEFARSFKEG